MLGRASTEGERAEVERYLPFVAKQAFGITAAHWLRLSVQHSPTSFRGALRPHASTPLRANLEPH